MDKHNIKINISDVYRYIGCRGEPEDKIKTDIIKAAELIIENVHPRNAKKICNIDRSNGLSLAGTCLKLEGKSIEALLYDCKICAIFCATIGNDYESLIKKWQIKDIAFSSMLDACASSAVESLCDSIESEIKAEYEAQGLFITDRFSPGYGDLSISIQKDFCSVLDTSRRIGVCVSDSGLLLPRKSITAIIGISDKEQNHRINGCISCDLKDSCKFRENGVTCYGQVI